MTGRYANQRLERSGGPRGSAGGTVLYVLMFITATIVIMGLAVAWDKRARTSKLSPEELRAKTQAQADSYSEEYRAARGDAYYENQGLRPNLRPRNPETPSTVPEVVTPAVETKPTVPERQFVGRVDWDRYHRPDCKYAMRTPEEERIYFTSAEDARSKGYIPCKVCKPPLPEGTLPGPVERVVTRTVIQPQPKPVKPVEKPVSLPVEDVSVGFPFTVVEREDVQESGMLRVELTVEVARPLRRPDVMALAQKLVAAETRERKVNAVSIFMRSKVESSTLLKWVCMVDWAPYGNLTRASEVPAGDYRTHQFNIFDQGFFKR